MSAAKKKKTTAKASAKKTSKKASAKKTDKKVKAVAKKKAKSSAKPAAKTAKKAVAKKTEKKAKAKAPAKKAAKAPAKAVAKTAKKVSKPAPKAAPKKAAKPVKPAKVAKAAESKPAKVEKPAKKVKAAKVKTEKAVEEKVQTPKVDPKSITEGLVKTDAKPKVSDVLLTDAEGRVLCRFAGCDVPAVVEAYCRYHYLLNWKKIQLRKKILAEGKLENYINELTARYPDKYLEMMKSDLKTEKDFLAAVQELEIDDPDAAMSDADAENYLEEVRGIRGDNRGSSDDDY